jgi:hypothetical protein
MYHRIAGQTLIPGLMDKRYANEMHSQLDCL